MAEVVAVVGIIASVLGILDGIDKSKTIFKNYVHSSSSLRAELLPILGKLSAFAGILRGLQLQCELDEANDDRLKVLGHIKQPLKASEEAVRLIAARLNQVVSLGRVSLSFGKVLNKETTAALHILDQARPVLDLALAADQRTIVKSIETYVRNVAQDLQEARLENKLHYDQLKGRLYEIQAKEVDSTQAKVKAEVLAWVSQVDCTSNYHAAREPTQHVDTSGDWFIVGKAFQNWASRKSDSQLLLIGISGSGKTVLCAKSIEHLSRIKTATGASPTILYFFFDFNDAAKETAEGMVRALLCQLLRSVDAVPDDVQNFYAKYQGTTSAKPSLRDWVDLLARSLQPRQDVYIFIDALDECSEAEMPLLRAALTKLLAATTANVKWLLTCRPHESATIGLYGARFTKVFMERTTVDKDIEMFLKTSLKSDPRLASFSKAAGDSIISEITLNSAGMFRYAQCQLDTVSKLRDRRIKKVQDVLRTMPKTISEIYRRILSGAEQLDDWAVIQRIILLVSFSTRPVSTAEVSEFAILEDDMTGVDPEDRLDLSDALATISPMITVRDGYITLAHKSVHDFFSEATDLPWSLMYLCQNADTSIAKKCLQYLGIAQEPVANISDMRAIREPNTTQLGKLLREYPFLDYAATYWAHHLPERQLQEEILESLTATLPLNSTPNLWKAWLLLQRAEIWENQVVLAGILCKTFVRGSLVTSWSQNFWQERQNYRIRIDQKAKVPPKRFIRASPKAVRSQDARQVTQAEPKSNFWVTAVGAQGPSSYGEPSKLLCDKGELIFIRSTESGQDLNGKKLWYGCSNGRNGFVSPALMERCPSTANPRISGRLYHELAILLLEVAFQVPLSKEAMALWTAASSINDLAEYLAQLRDLISQATRKMGMRYGLIVDECLSHVQWLEGVPGIRPDVHDEQTSCMEKVCQPLAAIRSSGFRAARAPMKRQATFQADPYAPNTVSYGGYISSAASAPYRSAASVGFTSYATNRLGSAPWSVGPGGATSTGPRWAASSASATFASQSATYSHSPTVGSAYRATSASATAYSQGATAPAYLVGRQDASTVVDPYSATYPPVAPPPSAVPNYQSMPLSVMEPVLEAEDLNPPSQTAETATSTTAVYDYASYGAEDHYSARSKLQAIPERTAPNITEPPGIENAIPLNAPSKDSHPHDINVRFISWDLTDYLSYNHYVDGRDSYESFYVTVSDDEWEGSLDGAREAALASDDVETRLLWARDALQHVLVAEGNRSRTFRQASRPVNVAWPEDDIHRDALSVITSLAQQGDLEALYLEAKYLNARLVGVGDELAVKRSLERFMAIADLGHAGACYRVAAALEAIGEEQASATYYAKGVTADSAGALYATGVKTIRGTNEKSLDITCLLPLVQAGNHADADAPEVLYELGLIYAYESSLFEGAQTPVPRAEKLAVDYIEKAAYFGSAPAQLRLGRAYEFGELGLRHSLSLALHHYLLAARRGESEAEFGISKIMLHLLTQGENENDPRKQKEMAHATYAYAARAALDDHPLALFAVGYYHETGIHVVADAREALAWYDRAAACGNADARARIAILRGDDALEQAPIEEMTNAPPPPGLLEREADELLSAAIEDAHQGTAGDEKEAVGEPVWCQFTVQLQLEEGVIEQLKTLAWKNNRYPPRLPPRMPASDARKNGLPPALPPRTPVSDMPAPPQMEQRPPTRPPPPPPPAPVAMAAKITTTRITGGGVGWRAMLGQKAKAKAK